MRTVQDSNPSRTEVLRPSPAKLPKALRQMRRWMGTRFEPRPGDPDRLNKPPYRVRRGQKIIKAAKTDPENWATFVEALEALERGAVDAIGFVVTEDDPLWFLDEDDVIDPETGEINPTAHHIVHALGTYAEISCSGRGLRAVGIGRKPEYAGCKSRALGFGAELYDGTSRNPHASGVAFLVITGNHLSGTPEEVEERQSELEALCRQLWPAKLKKKRQRKQAKSSAQNIDDAELLERAGRSRTGAKFRALYDRGDTSRYPSESEADYALLNMLCFWTAGDLERMVRMFEGSALYRPEEKHRGYVELSARNALASYTGRFYRPRRVDTLKPDAKDDALAPYMTLLLDPAAWRGRRAASAYKVYAAAVILAAERGIDADGQLRVGSDVRTLAEVAGVSAATASRSALPYLMSEMKLLRWRRGKGTKAGEFVLLTPYVQSDNTKVTTHFSVISSHISTDTLLTTLRLLIRMRSGRDKRAFLERQGPLFLFATVTLLSAGARGYSAEELREKMGRSIRGQRWLELAARLKASGVAREPSAGHYRLTDGFRAAYERQLQHSGIVASERRQRRQHAEQRKRREEELGRRRRGEPASLEKDVIKRSDANLKGSDAVQETLAGMQPEYRRQRRERERERVGRTYSDEQRVRWLIRQGMAERFARQEVYGAKPGARPRR